MRIEEFLRKNGKKYNLRVIDNDNDNTKKQFMRAVKRG